MSQPAEQITATILGCGSSGGVPRVGNLWGDCDPDNPYNRRRRCSLLISGRSSGSDAPTNVLIDTGCDMREQLLDANVSSLGAVLYTHEHADHTHGIDDLRALALINKQRVPVFFSDRMRPRLLEAFGYCFETPPGGHYPPILDAHTIEAGQKLDVDGPGGTISISAFSQIHGDIESLGFRVGGFAYSCDVSGFPEESLAAISGLDVWVVDALRRAPHPSHLNLEESLNWIERMQPGQAVLTNLHNDLDYAALDAETPASVTPAFDGMVIDVTAGRIASI